jgi:hypothetical protein
VIRIARFDEDAGCGDELGQGADGGGDDRRAAGDGSPDGGRPGRLAEDRQDDGPRPAITAASRSGERNGAYEMSSPTLAGGRPGKGGPIVRARPTRTIRGGHGTSVAFVRDERRRAIGLAVCRRRRPLVLRPRHAPVARPQPGAGQLRGPGGGQARQRPEQRPEVLPRVVAARIDEIALGQSEPGDLLGASRGRGRAERRPGGERDDVDPVATEVEQPASRLSGGLGADDDGGRVAQDPHPESPPEPGHRPGLVAPGSSHGRDRGPTARPAGTRRAGRSDRRVVDGPMRAASFGPRGAEGDAPEEERVDRHRA